MTSAKFTSFAHWLSLGDREPCIFPTPCTHKAEVSQAPLWVLFLFMLTVRTSCTGTAVPLRLGSGVLQGACCVRLGAILLCLNAFLFLEASGKLIYILHICLVIKQDCPGSKHNTPQCLHFYLANNISPRRRPHCDTFQVCSARKTCLTPEKGRELTLTGSRNSFHGLTRIISFASKNFLVIF